MLWRSSFNSAIARVADFCTAFFSYTLSYVLWTVLHRAYPDILPTQAPLRFHLILLAGVFSLLYVLLFEFHKAYSYQRFTSLWREYLIVGRAAVLALLANVLMVFMLGLDTELRRTFFVLSFLISMMVFLAEKTALFFVADILRKTERNRKRVLLIGTGTRAKHFIDTVSDHFSWGLDIVGLLTGDMEKVGQQFYGVTVLDTFCNIERVLKEVNPEEIIVTISTRRFGQVRTVFEACEREGVQLRLNSDFFGEVTKRVRVDNVYGLSIISFDMAKRSQSQLFFKRGIDIVGATTGLLIFLPFMLAGAIGIWITDGRPILYQSPAVGFNKKRFKTWKLRTMVRDADTLKRNLIAENEMQGPVFKIREDPRIIPFGKWLRKYSIDEAPQLFSVLKGDMSLVGPRQARPDEFEHYESWHRKKLSVKPGLTCLWQINGRNELKNFDHWVKLDLEYINRWSIWLDLKILIKTIPAVLSGKGS